MSCRVNLSTNAVGEYPRSSIALREIQQKNGQSLFGAHAAQEKHQAVVACDFAGQDLVQIVLQRFHVASEILQAIEWQDTNFGVLQRDRFAVVAFGCDAIHADDVAQHVITGDLLVPI